MEDVTVSIEISISSTEMRLKETQAEYHNLMSQFSSLSLTEEDHAKSLPELEHLHEKIKAVMKAACKDHKELRHNMARLQEITNDMEKVIQNFETAISSANTKLQKLWDSIESASVASLTTNIMRVIKSATLQTQHKFDALNSTLCDVFIEIPNLLSKDYSVENDLRKCQLLVTHLNGEEAKITTTHNHEDVNDEAAEEVSHTLTTTNENEPKANNTISEIESTLSNDAEEYTNPSSSLEPHEATSTSAASDIHSSFNVSDVPVERLNIDSDDDEFEPCGLSGDANDEVIDFTLTTQSNVDNSNDIGEISTLCDSCNKSGGKDVFLDYDQGTTKLDDKDSNDNQYSTAMSRSTASNPLSNGNETMPEQEITGTSSTVITSATEADTFNTKQDTETSKLALNEDVKDNAGNIDEGVLSALAVQKEKWQEHSQNADDIAYEKEREHRAQLRQKKLINEENEARQFLETLLGVPLNGNLTSTLKSGVVLCEVS